VVGHGGDRHAVAEVADVPRAEHLLPGHGVHAVRADDQVEPAADAAREGDLDVAGGLAEVRDLLTPEVLDALGRLEQQAEQVPAEDLGVVVVAAAEGVAIHAREPAAVAVDERALANAGGPLADLVEQTHALDDRQGGAADVDLVAAVADGPRPLDDGRREPVATQPVGEGNARDAGAGDEDGGALHGLLLRLLSMTVHLCQTDVQDICVVQLCHG